MDSRQELLPSFPLQAIIKTMTIIMTNNYFEFRDTFFLQLPGTAMVTLATAMWVTLYYVYHKEYYLIPRHGAHPTYYRRFIDDMIIIWVVNTPTATRAL